MSDTKGRLYLISCVSQKRASETVASDLYISAWFKKARSHVLAAQVPWRILSAKHGLLHPDTVIGPYEMTLNHMPIPERRVWATRVMSDLEPLLREAEQVVVFAGARYREFLVPALRRRGVEVATPLEGLGLGEQLRWLTQRSKPSL